MTANLIASDNLFIEREQLLSAVILFNFWGGRADNKWLVLVTCYQEPLAMIPDMKTLS